MCQILKVSRSSYYHWTNKRPSKRLLRRLELDVAIKKNYDWSKGRYGSPRITKELQMQGVKASHPFVAAIIKKKDLRSVTVRRFKQTANSNHSYGIVKNELSQNFTTTTHDKVWV